MIMVGFESMTPIKVLNQLALWVTYQSTIMSLLDCVFGSTVTIGRVVTTNYGD